MQNNYNQQIQNIDKVLALHSLDKEDYAHIKKILGREPNIVELGIFSAMWSEHCSYKSSRIYLRGFPVEAPYVVQGPGENAGVIDVGENKVAVFKMESHNHPSFIEPFQGAATGVGGILRDIFTMGARPIANLNSIRYAPIDNEKYAKQHTYLLKRSVEGIGNYGNCMGIPTIGGEVAFEECYGGNILINAFALGIANKDEVFYSKAEGLGNPIIYAGSKTGRDGLGGAVMSSNSFEDDASSKKPTVQVGDPFTEKLLLEACLEVFSQDLIVGIQDMGAAGLTSSAFEMADKSKSGIRLDLDKVPAREENMTPYDFMLSESQERMLLCAKRGKEQEVIDIFEKWGLSCSVIGEVTDTQRVDLYWHSELSASVPVKEITDEAPMLNRPTARPKYLDTLQPSAVDFEKFSVQESFLKLLGSIDVADKSYVYDQYDSTVQTNTLVRPGDLDASVVRVKETSKALAIALHCNARYCYLDPKAGSALSVAIAGRKVACKGAVPKAITDCLNFGNPQNPEIMWQFRESCEGIKEACLKLHTPVVSGNVSLYNETNGEGIYPTPGIGMVGVVEQAKKTLPSYLQKTGSFLALVGAKTQAEFDGGLYLKNIHNELGKSVPTLDFDLELKLWQWIEKANEKNLLLSCKDCFAGGIAINLAKMSARGGVGVEAKIELENEYLLFSETQSRVIVECESVEELRALCAESRLECEVIGETKESGFVLNGICVSLDELRGCYYGSFEKVIEKII